MVAPEQATMETGTTPLDAFIALFGEGVTAVRLNVDHEQVTKQMKIGAITNQSGGPFQMGLHLIKNDAKPEQLSMQAKKKAHDKKYDGTQPSVVYEARSSDRLQNQFDLTFPTAAGALQMSQGAGKAFSNKMPNATLAGTDVTVRGSRVLMGVKLQVFEGETQVLELQTKRDKSLQWCCLAFACFFPTCGIASCVILSQCAGQDPSPALAKAGEQDVAAGGAWFHKDGAFLVFNDGATAKQKAYATLALMRQTTVKVVDFTPQSTTAGGGM